MIADDIELVQLGLDRLSFVPQNIKERLSNAKFSISFLLLCYITRIRVLLVFVAWILIRSLLRTAKPSF